MVYIVNGKAAEFSEVNQNEGNVLFFLKQREKKIVKVKNDCTGEFLVNNFCKYFVKHSKFTLVLPL